MKENKWSSEEVLVEMITSMAAAELEEQEKNMGSTAQGVDL